MTETALAGLLGLLGKAAVIGVAIAVIYLLFTISVGVPAEEQQCKQACEGFGLDFHSFEGTISGTKWSRCWCLKEGLPYEVPLK